MKWLACAIGLLLVAAARGDIVHLADGGTVEGTVHRTDEGYTVTTAEKIVKLQADQVKSIELTKSTNTSAGAVAERLASMRRSVENVSDPAEAIIRYQRFIEQNSDAPEVADAKKDLLIWQDRSGQKMVKVGSEWVTAQRRSQMVVEAQGQAEQARQLLKQGRSKEAEPLLVQAVVSDGHNVTALYLLGLLRYQQDQVTPARKAFETLASVLPDHAPTLNNLAVALWRQKQYVQAMQNYDAAMLASPVNKLILDNVFSALRSLPNDVHASPIVAKAQRRFTEQDKQLAEQMAANGWFRVGGAWVTRDQVEAARAHEKEVQDKLNAMAADFDAQKSKVEQIDRNIEDTQATMRRLEASSWVRDANGNLVQFPLPPTYFDLQRDVQRYQGQRAREAGKLDTLQQQARQLKATLDSPQAAATVQRLFGPEGTPLVLKEPASQPTMKETK